KTALHEALSFGRLAGFRAQFVAEFVHRNVEQSRAWRVGHAVPTLRARHTRAKDLALAGDRLLAADQHTILGETGDPVTNLGDIERTNHLACRTIVDESDTAFV